MIFMFDLHSIILEYLQNSNNVGTVEELASIIRKEFLKGDGDRYVKRGLYEIYVVLKNKLNFERWYHERMIDYYRKGSRVVEQVETEYKHWIIENIEYTLKKIENIVKSDGNVISIIKKKETNIPNDILNTVKKYGKDFQSKLPIKTLS